MVIHSDQRRSKMITTKMHNRKRFLITPTWDRMFRPGSASTAARTNSKWNCCTRHIKEIVTRGGWLYISSTSSACLIKPFGPLNDFLIKQLICRIISRKRFAKKKKKKPISEIHRVYQLYTAVYTCTLSFWFSVLINTKTSETLLPQEVWLRVM